MTQATLCLPIELVRSVVAREEAGDDRYESQDNPDHVDSKQAEEWRSQAFADAMCLGDAGW